MSRQPNIDQLDLAITNLLANPNVVPSEAWLADLLVVTRDLSAMPATDFKEKLRLELERKAAMSTKTIQLREVFRTVTPYIFVPEAEELIGFVQKVFAAKETGRSIHDSGAIHAEVRIGDSMIMIGGGTEYKGPSKPMILRVLVANSDEVYQR